MNKESKHLERSKLLFNIEKAILKNLPLKFETLGKENVDRVRELLNNGKIVVATLDHKSLADIASGAIASFKDDFGDIVSEAVFVIAQKYLDFPLTNFLIKSIKKIPVVSPTMEDDPRQKEMNSKALHYAWNLDPGTLLILTPEAQRIRGDRMEKARREVVSFWHSARETYLFPIALEGTEVQWTPGVAGTLKYIAGGFRHPVKIIFGQPYKVEHLKLEVRNATDFDKKQLEVDLAMLNIALLHIYHGDPKYTQGYYENLLRDLETKVGVTSKVS